MIKKEKKERERESGSEYGRAGERVGEGGRESE